MDRHPALLVGTLAAAALLAGCTGGIFGNVSQQGTAIIEIGTHPPDDSVGNRSDIDDFQTLEIRLLSAQASPTRGSHPIGLAGGGTVDLVDAVDDPTVLVTDEAPSGEYDRFTIRVELVTAIHNNGSEPVVRLAPDGLYFVRHSPESEEGRPEVPQDGELRYRFVLAVAMDNGEDVNRQDTEKGDYFVWRHLDSGPVR